MKERILLYVRIEYVSLYSGVISNLQNIYDFVCVVPTIVTYNALRPIIDTNIKIYCIEKELNNYSGNHTDDELSKMEDELGETLLLLNFSELFIVKMSEGVYYHKDRNLQFYQRSSYCYYLLFKKIFETDMPNYIFFEVINSAFSIICQNLAKKYNIPCVSLVTAYLDNSFYFSVGRSAANPIFKEEYRKIDKSEYSIGEELAQKILYNKMSSPGYMEIEKKYKSNRTFIIKVVDALKFNAIKKIGCGIIKFYWSYLFNRKALTYSSVPNVLQLLVQRRWKMPRGRKYLRSVITSPVSGEKFFIYFVHFQPEASTSAQSSLYVNQEYILETLAVTIPQSYKLYIKDHSTASGMRGKQFFERFKYYPNIRLINPSISSKELIAKASGVITITGTSGFEAAILNKPVVIFGNTYYDFLKNVHKVNNFYDLPGIFKNIEHTENMRNTRNDENSLRITAAYVKSLYKGYVNPYFNGHNLATKDNINNVSKSIISFIKLLEKDQFKEMFIKYII